MSQKGFTAVELIVAMVLGAIVLTISVPAFIQFVRQSRHDAAVRRLVSDVREARSQAITTGWQYRVVGYDSDEAGNRRNHYRLLARRSSAFDWPGEEDAPFQTDTQLAARWVDVTSEYPGVTFDGPAARFEITFDYRGTAQGADTTFNPLRLVGDHGHEASLSVSVVGSIRVE